MAINFNDTTPAPPAGGLNVKWQKDASNPVNISGYLPAAGQPYDVWWSLPGKPSANTTYLIGKFVRPVTFPGNFAGANGSDLVNPAATATYTLKKNGSACGTVVISTSGVFTFTSTGGTPVAFVAGDVLTVVSPTVQDTTLSDAGFTLPGVTV